MRSGPKGGRTNRFQGTLPKLLLLLSSLAIVLLFLEIGLRLQGGDEEDADPAEQTEQALDEQGRALPEIGFWDLQKPNQVGINRGVPFRTNSAGFRGREFSKEKPEGVLRIVVIGDSVTMGQGVEEEFIYTTRFEEDLRRELGIDVEVLNLGVSGFNLRASLRRLKHIGLGFSPDVVIYGFTTNDLDNHKSYRRTRTGSLHSVLSSTPSHAHRWILRRWMNLRSLIYPDPGSYIYELDENYFRNPGLWQTFTKEMMELKRVTSERDICLAVFIHAHRSGSYRLSPFTRYHDAVRNLAGELGIPVIGTREYYLAHNPEGHPISPVDPHPNALGHAELSKALLSGFLQLPESCRTP